MVSIFPSWNIVVHFTIFLSLLVLAPARSHCQNLLVNGDFELTEGGTLQGWKLVGQNDGPFDANDGGFIRGKTSLHLKYPLDKETKTLNEIYATSTKPLPGISGGKDYRLTFYARSPIPGQVMWAMYYTRPNKLPHFYKKETFVLTDAWSKYDFVLKLPDPWDNRELTIRFGISGGEVFVDDAVFQQDSQALKASTAAISGAAVQTQVQGQKNMIVNPGFELGWIGWGTANYRDDEAPYEKEEVPSGIDQTIKYEGTSSLRVEPNDCVVSVRFPLDVDELYTLSFYARGEKTKGKNHEAKVNVLNTLWKNNKAITLKVGEQVNSEWKRFTLPVTIKDLGSHYRNTVYVRIDSHDTRLWIDGMQLEKGTATNYNGGIQAGILTTSSSGLFSLGTSEQVSVGVSCPGGLPHKVDVSLTARDIFSNVLWKKEISFEPTSSDLSTTAIRIENKTLGVVEVTAAVGLPGQIPISANTWRYCVIDGKPEETQINPLFGTENALGFSKWNEEYNETMSKYLGSGFTRVFSLKNKDDTESALAIVREQLAWKKGSGKKVMICVHGGKNAFIDAHMSLDKELTDTDVAKDVALYTDRCTKIATALRGVVDYYQILNEPNIWHAHGGALKGAKLLPPDRYLKFVAAGSRAIRAADPTAKVVANINGTDPVYTEALFAAGVDKYIDAFTIHSYRQSPENPPVFDSIIKLRTVIDKYSKGMPIINDEQYFGARDMVSVSAEDLKDYYSDTQLEQSGRIIQNYLHHIAADQVPWSTLGVQLMLYRFGMGNPTYFYPSFGGYRFASQTLHDIRKGMNVDVDPNLRVFLFERQDGLKIVSINTKSFDVKGGVRKVPADAAYDVNGNPNSVTDLPVNYLPSYFWFKNSTTDQIITKLKQADYYGFSSPLRGSVIDDHGAVRFLVENCENHPVNATVEFTRMPEGWPIPEPVNLTNMPGASKKEFPIQTGDQKRVWDKDYSITYRAVVGDKIINKTLKLPSIEILKKKITINGDLSDWRGVEEIRLGEDHLSFDYSEGKLPHQGPKDLSAFTSITWDENNVYCLVKVTDDKFVPGNGVQFHNFDSVQVYFDMQNDGSKNYDGNDAAYTIGFDKDGKALAYLDKNPTGRYVGGGNLEKGVDVDVKVASKRTDDGYIVELAFPQSTLPYLDLKSGAVFGFAILVNDNDGTMRKQGVTMTDKGTEPSNSPFRWRSIKLGDK